MRSERALENVDSTTRLRSLSRWSHLDLDAQLDRNDADQRHDRRKGDDDPNNGTGGVRELHCRRMREHVGLMR